MDRPDDSSGDRPDESSGDRSDGSHVDLLDETSDLPDDPARRIDRLFEIARREQAAVDGSVDPDEHDSQFDPEKCAMRYLRGGLWPTIETYIDVVSGGGRLDEDVHERHEKTLNIWLKLYARCYGVEIDPEIPVRQAAALFVDTHNINDTAQLLTDVPDRARERRNERTGSE